MSNLYASVKALTCLLLFAFLLYSCKKETNSTIYLSSVAVSDKFLKANKDQNIVFNYYIDGTIGLRGWVLRKGTDDSSSRFNATPDIILNSVSKSAIKIEPKTFLSNQVLPASQVNALINAIGPKEAILYFNPAKDAATGYIFYNITFKYKDEGSAIGIGTSASASPAPLETYRTNPTPPYPYP